MALTILVVEDDALVADALRDALRAEGYKAVTCGNGVAALRALSSPESYDLLITDNQLPGVGGLEIVRRARSLAHRARMPIVMLSADDCREEAERAGADLFLRKPDDLGELIPAVARLLHRGAESRAP